MDAMSTLSIQLFGKFSVHAAPVQMDLHRSPHPATTRLGASRLVVDGWIRVLPQCG
jgi:hypothetical protein